MQGIYCIESIRNQPVHGIAQVFRIFPHVYSARLLLPYCDNPVCVVPRLCRRIFLHTIDL